MAAKQKEGLKTEAHRADPSDGTITDFPAIYHGVACSAECGALPPKVGEASPQEEISMKRLLSKLKRSAIIVHTLHATE